MSCRSFLIQNGLWAIFGCCVISKTVLGVFLKKLEILNFFQNTQNCFAYISSYLYSCAVRGAQGNFVQKEYERGISVYVVVGGRPSEEFWWFYTSLGRIGAQHRIYKHQRVIMQMIYHILLPRSTNLSEAPAAAELCLIFAVRPSAIHHTQPGKAWFPILNLP